MKILVVGHGANRMFLDTKIKDDQFEAVVSKLKENQAFMNDIRNLIRIKSDLDIVISGYEEEDYHRVSGSLCAWDETISEAADLLIAKYGNYGFARFTFHPYNKFVGRKVAIYEIIDGIDSVPNEDITHVVSIYGRKLYFKKEK